jgi:hypothetical protein
MSIQLRAALFACLTLLLAPLGPAERGVAPDTATPASIDAVRLHETPHPAPSHVRGWQGDVAADRIDGAAHVPPTPRAHGISVTRTVATAHAARTAHSRTRLLLPLSRAPPTHS